MGMYPPETLVSDTEVGEGAVPVINLLVVLLALLTGMPEEGRGAGLAVELVVGELGVVDGALDAVLFALFTGNPDEGPGVRVGSSSTQSQGSVPWCTWVAFPGQWGLKYGTVKLWLIGM